MRRAFLFAILFSCGSSSLTIAMVQQNNSGQEGVATLTDSPGGLEILVSITQSSFAGSQTSHVHDGRCDNVGAITAGITRISDKSEAPESDGGIIFFRAQLMGTTLSKLRDGNHVINVHDARDNSLYVSCGEID